MGSKRYTPEQIISMLREAEVALLQGQTVGQVCRVLGVSEQSYYRWRREYGGLKIDQEKCLKDLVKENVRLRRAISDLTLDKLILKEALEGIVLRQLPLRVITGPTARLPCASANWPLTDVPVLYPESGDHGLRRPILPVSAPHPLEPPQFHFICRRTFFCTAKPAKGSSSPFASKLK